VNGQQEYTRTCDKDTAVFADETKNECSGPTSMMADCGEFVFGDWEEWLYCSENCGIGVTTRTRTCSPVGNSTCPTDGPLVIESKPCQIQKCLTCENYENYCDSQVNTQCKDITLENGETTAQCQCKSPFGLDDFGQCTKCNALAPFKWQCGEFANDGKAAGAKTQIAWTLLGLIMAFQYILN